MSTTDNSNRINLKTPTKTYSRKKSPVSVKEKSNNSQHRVEILTKSPVNIQKKLFFQNLSSGNFPEESQSGTGVLSKKFKVNGTKQQLEKNSIKPKARRSLISNGSSSLGKDWDEMEFLGGNSDPYLDNHSNDTLTITTLKNIKYARTRNNLEKIKHARQPRKMPKKQHAHSTLPAFLDSTVILNSPVKSLKTSKDHSAEMLHSALQGEELKIPQSDKRPSLMDMVRKFSSVSNVSSDVSDQRKGRKLLEKDLKFPKRKKIGKANVSTSSSPESDRIDDPLFDMLDNKRQSNPNIKQQKTQLIKNSISSKVSKSDFKQPVIQKAPSAKKKNSKVIAKRNTLKDKLKQQPIEIVNASSPQSGISENTNDQITNNRGRKRSPRKKNCDVLVQKPNKAPKLEYNNSTLKDCIPIIEDAKQVSESTENVQINEDVSSMIEEYEKSSEILPPLINDEFDNYLLNLNSNQVIPQATVMNNMMFASPATQNNVVNSYITPEMNNGLVYVNPIVPSFQPFQNPELTNIFIVPVPCGNCNHAPNIAESFNSANNNSIVRLSCSGANVDNVLNSIVTRLFNQPAQQNVNNLCNNSNTEVHSDDVQKASNIANISSENPAEIHNFPSATVSKVVETSHTKKRTKYQETTSEITRPILSSEVSESDTELKIVGRPVTNNLNSTLIDHLCELKKNQKDVSFNQCRKNTNDVMKKLFSCFQWVSVEKFYTYPDVEEFLTNFDTQSSNILPLEYKLSENYKDSYITNVLKSYVSFHVKEIFKAIPKQPFNVSLNLILEEGNSKLNIAERNLLKILFSPITKITGKDLIGGLYYVGLNTIFNEFKKL